MKFASAAKEEITKQVVAAGATLRFDKVALRLLDEVQASVAQTLSKNKSIAFTVTAPIKQPSKTCAALQEWLKNLSAHKSKTTIHGNSIHARMVNHCRIGTPKVIGFVHNANEHADAILEVAEIGMREE